MHRQPISAVHPTRRAISPRRGAVLVMAGAAVLMFSAACGDDDNGYGTTTTATSSAATSTAAAAPSGAAANPTTSTSAPAGATTVTVTETDFALSLSQNTFTPGTYTFVAKNGGKAPHALEVEGPGVESETSTFGPGGSDSLTVTLQPGKYRLYCPVGNHAAMGMTLDITVA